MEDQEYFERLLGLVEAQTGFQETVHNRITNLEAINEKLSHIIFGNGGVGLAEEIRKIKTYSKTIDLEVEELSKYVGKKVDKAVAATEEATDSVKQSNQKFKALLWMGGTLTISFTGKLIFDVVMFIF